MSMNILVVSSKYHPEFSGSGLRAHNTYLRLREKFGIESEVIASSIEFPQSENYSIDGISVERIVASKTRSLARKIAGTPLFRVANALMFHAEARAVRKALATRQFDLVHVFGYSPATVAAIQWCRKNDVPLMLELVNMVDSPYQYLPATRRFSGYDLVNKSVIVAISQELANRCKTAGLTSNVWTRPNPVDVSKYTPASEEKRTRTRAKLGPFSDSDKVVVYVAKFLGRKNHVFLIDALKHLPVEYKLVLAGPPLADSDSTPGLTLAQMPSLKNKARELGVADRLTVIPELVDHSEFLAAADVSCFPSEDEAMGTPLLEAIAAGIPVVANADEPSFREWIVDGENGYLEPLNAAKWASSITEAANFSQTQRSNMAAEINSKVSTEFIDQRYKLLLNRLLTANADETIDVATVLDR